jgi:ppGpp synthetase/RelA/SpoT-type nucleotidyltranferase
MERSATPKDIVSEFIARFRREFDFYEQAGRIVAQRIETRLEASGVRAMVTSRAKNPKRLEVKVRQRNTTREFGYQSVEEIYADIVDLAGVRVALYFPGERDEVDKILKEIFELSEIPKIFTGTSQPNDKKRFSGYWATHYRLRLKDDSLTEQSLRFADARVEVQVASVLMHAWSEVEHDLVYKPMQGTLSEDELAILDELNGMVLTGESALERLQRAAKARVSAKGARFENHYDLASFLLEFGKLRMGTSDREPVIGDVETLFRLLNELEIFNPEILNPYLNSLTTDSEQRPLSQQIVDQIVAAHPDRYAAYATIRSDSNTSDHSSKADSEIISTLDPRYEEMAFVMQWIIFERFLREIALTRGFQPETVMAPNRKILENLDIFTDEEIQKIEQIRMIRNEIVHGIRKNRAPVSLRSEGETLSNILARLKDDANPEVAKAVERVASELIKVEHLYGKIQAPTPKQSKFDLSMDAKELLCAAAADERGQIIKLAFIGGRVIHAGAKQYGQENARESSRWEAALNELLNAKLVDVRGHKGEVFSLTHAGWEMAESLSSDGST